MRNEKRDERRGGEIGVAIVHWLMVKELRVEDYLYNL